MGLANLPMAARPTSSMNSSRGTAQGGASLETPQLAFALGSLGIVGQDDVVGLAVGLLHGHPGPAASTGRGHRTAPPDRPRSPRPESGGTPRRGCAALTDSLRHGRQAERARSTATPDEESFGSRALIAKSTRHRARKPARCGARRPVLVSRAPRRPWTIPPRQTGGAPASAARPATEADEFAAIPRAADAAPTAGAGRGRAGAVPGGEDARRPALLPVVAHARRPGRRPRAAVVGTGPDVLAEGTNRLVRDRGHPRPRRAPCRSTPRARGPSPSSSRSWAPTAACSSTAAKNRCPRLAPSGRVRGAADPVRGSVLRGRDPRVLRQPRQRHALLLARRRPARWWPPRGSAAPATLRDLHRRHGRAGPERHPGHRHRATRARSRSTLPIARFAESEAARGGAGAARAAAVAAHGTAGSRVATPSSCRSPPTNGAARIATAARCVGDIDQRVKIHDVRETVKVRAERSGAPMVPSWPSGDGAGASGTPARAAPRILDNVDIDPHPGAGADPRRTPI